jgi:autotransporter-associated beta strand protein
VGRRGSHPGAVTAGGILSADNATLSLSSSSTTTFTLADGGVSGSIVGTGTVNLDGTFSLNTASVTDTLAYWSLVDVGNLTETFGANFSVAGYTESGGTWTSGNFTFNEATGLVSVGDVWAVDADGDYSTGSNWNKGAAPAGNTDVLFSNLISENRTVTLDNGGATVVVNSVTFDNELNAGDYFIVPSTTESLTVTSGDVNVRQGRHWLRAPVAGTNGLNVSGSGELVLDADNSFSGGITIDGTPVSVVNTEAIPAGNNITLQNGGQLRFFGPNNGFFVDTNGSAGYGTGTVNGTITLNTGTLVRVIDGANVTFAGAISGDGHIEVNSNGAGTGGTATFTVANTYTGTTQTWNDGVLALSGAGTLGVSDGTVANCTYLSNQGQLALSSVAVGNEFIYLDASADTNQAKIASSGNSSIAGNIYASEWGTGVYKITSAAGGTLTLSGTLSGVDDDTPTQHIYIFGGDGDINITGRITDSAVDATGNITGPSTGDNVQVVKRGAGTMTVNTNVDDDYWYGNTTVEGGTLELVANASSSNELFSPLTTVRAGATLDISTFSIYDVGVSDALAGGGTINVGSGELAIYDDNSITPGDSVGTLHVTGNVSLTSDVTGGSLNYELGNTTTVGGTENDLLAISGTLTTYGTPTMSLNVNFVEGSIAAGGSSYTLATFASSSAPTVSGLTPQVVDSDGNAMTIRPTLAVSSTTTAIKLGVTGNTQSYNWSGNTNGTWDKGSGGTNNWTSSDSKFYDLDSVTFGSGPTNTAVTVSEPVAPNSMTVNGGASYQFSGSDINAASVTVTGSATANFSNSVGGAVTVASTGTLAGTGTFKNNVTVQSGGKIRIGAAGLATATGLLDNFNSYDNSTITTIGANVAGDATGGVWQGIFDGTDNARIFDDPAQNDGGTSDNMLEVYGANGAWRGAEANLATNFGFDRSIKNGNTSTTVFLQFQAKDPGAGNNMDSVWGLAGADENLNDGSPWNGYAIMGIVGDVGTPNNIHFRIFDGPGGTNSEVTVIDNMTLDTWYNAWFVVDEAAETFDLYTSTGTDAGTLVGTYSFGRATGTSGLQKLGFTELASSGGDTHDAALRIDNIYIAPGVDTTNPLVNGSWGGTVFATETMSVLGDLNLEAGSTVTFDIASSGVNDLLDIAGNLDVADGFVLEVLLDGSVSPSSLAAGDSWDLFDFSTSSGTFDETDFILPGGLGSNLAWDTSNLLVDGTISIVSLGLPGDYNNDGIVDAADYTVWRDHLGEADETALNGNGDGMNGVDEADFALWKSNFGATSGAGSGATAEPQGVPEPSSIVLLASLLVWGAFALRRRS